MVPLRPISQFIMVDQPDRRGSEPSASPVQVHVGKGFSKFFVRSDDFYRNTYIEAVAISRVSVTKRCLGVGIDWKQAHG